MSVPNSRKTARLPGDKSALPRFKAADSRLQIDVLFGRPGAVISARTIPERITTASKVYKAMGEGKRFRLMFFGTFDELQPTLKKRNAAGFAAFITINPTDGRGVKRENIVAVRNLCLDLDGAPCPKEWEIEPDLITETSRGKFQVFWNIKPAKDIEAAEDINRRLAAYYDGDPKVCDAGHVFRLAGFCHQKREPFRTRIVHAGFKPPTTLQAFAFLPKLPPRNAANRKKCKAAHGGGGGNVEKIIGRRAAALLFKHLDVEYLAGNERWEPFAMALHSTSDGDDAVAELFFKFCKTDENYKNADADAINRARWDSFRPNGGIGAGTLYKMCRDAKVPGDVVFQVFNNAIRESDYE